MGYLLRIANEILIARNNISKFLYLFEATFLILEIIQKGFD
jgi:hypothetical protein